MEHAADALTRWMLRREYINAGQQEWCRYMILHRGINAVTFALLVLAGSLLAGWQAAFSFVLCFRFLRTRTGGYHAATPAGCLLTSLTTQTVSLAAARWLAGFPALPVAAAASVAILWLAPANNAALHLTPAEFKALRPAIRRRVLAVLAACGLLTLFEPLWGGCIAAAMAAVAVLLALSAFGAGAQ